MNEMFVSGGEVGCMKWTTILAGTFKLNPNWHGR